MITKSDRINSSQFHNLFKESRSEEVKEGLHCLWMDYLRLKNYFL